MEYGIGTLVYFDSFAGLIKAKLLSFEKEDQALIKVTSNENKFYQYGSLITVNLLHVFPRECFKETTNGFRTLPYEWRKK